MTCPYCHHPLTKSTIKDDSNQEYNIGECFNCGGHWFPRWLANNISVESAARADDIEAKKELDRPAYPRCPICHDRLSLIKDDSVPHHVHIWTCPTGDGNFFPQGDLLNFKRAQKVKIDYHQLWGIPVKSIFSILLPVLIITAVATSIPLTLQQTQTTQENRTKASSTITNQNVINISPIEVSITFTTTQKTTSSLTIYQDGKKLETHDVSITPQTTHSISLKNLNPNTQYQYTLTLDQDPTTTTQKETFTTLP